LSKDIQYEELIKRSESDVEQLKPVAGLH